MIIRKKSIIVIAKSVEIRTFAVVKEMEMKLLEFNRQFGWKEECERFLKEHREKEGLECGKCGCKRHRWDKYNKRWVCCGCGHETTLTLGTVMHGSKLPLLYWFTAIHLMTSTKNTFSAAEMQPQLGHKRYQPVWEMMHKLRSVMGQRDGKYGPVDRPKKGKRGRKCGHLMMKVITDLKQSTFESDAKMSIDSKATVIMDDLASHAGIEKAVAKSERQTVPGKDAPKVLPWVHIAIANAKSLIQDMYHGVSKGLLRLYLDEFCYKFNRMHFGDRTFDRLVIATVKYILVCKTCNSSKGDLDLFEWYAEVRHELPSLLIIIHYLKNIYLYAIEHNLMEKTNGISKSDETSFQVSIHTCNILKSRRLFQEMINIEKYFFVMLKCNPKNKSTF